MAGGSCHDIRLTSGISKSAFYLCLKRCLNAVIACPLLSIELPETADEFKEIHDGFERLSLHGIMKGCIGAIDGFLALIQTPIAKDVGNVNDYFSGHYYHMGLNCQAMCDHLCRFTYFGVVSPGRTHDSSAFNDASELKQFIDNLTAGKYFVVSDAAYILTETLLTPYKGSQRMNEDKYAFNFYLSQLRIRIEQSFGMMVEKWRILLSPLPRSLKVSSKIIMACARLHNFCINERVATNCEPEICLRHVFTQRGEKCGYIYSDTRHYFGGHSIVRDNILRYRIVGGNVTRPSWNVLRNLNNDMYID